MQNEARLRLLRADTDSPSGYRIVGYGKFAHDKAGYYSFDTAEHDEGDYKSARYGVHCDAFELGVKVGDTWYYEGDMVMDKDAMPPSLPMILRYEYSWLIEHSSGRRVRLHDVAEYITSTGRTIHDTGGTQ